MMQIFKKRHISKKNINAKRSFLRDERGVTAIEFGFLAIPFLALVLVILETAIIFIAGMILDNAVNDTVRLIRTGQAENANFNITSFRADVCSGTVGMMACEDLRIRVREVATFNAANAVPVITNPVNGNWNVIEQYNDGVGGSVIVAEVYYKWDPVINFRWLNINAGPDGTVLLGSARVWRNEPF